MYTTRKLLWNIAGLLVVLSLVLSATFVFSAYPVSAQEEPPQDPQTEELPPDDDPTEAEVGQAAPEISALLNRTLKEGSVGVIVVLNVPETPEPEQTGEPAKVYAAAQDTLISSMAGLKVENIYPYQNFPLVAMRVDATALRALLRSKLVAAVEEDAKNYLFLQDSTVIVGATEAAQAGYTGTGLTVAVIDTGVDKNHAFLAGHVVEEACFSGGNGQGTSLCPNKQPSQTGLGAGVPCGMSGCEHGTHVAGIIAGNGAGFYGVARGANIIAINVFTNAGGSLLTFNSDYIKALDYVYSLRKTFTISSVNMSLGGGGYTRYCDSVLPAGKQAIARLRSANIATVIASGNDGYINAISRPACISNAISVGSTDKSDNVSSFSNSASFLALLAPGQAIYSSIPGGGYDTFNGTSMAAPHVAGAWAVLRQAFPTKSVSSLLSLLKSTGVKVKDYRNGKVKPRIDIAYVLGKYQKPAAAPALLAPAEGETLADSTPELTWTKLPQVTKYKVVVKLGKRTAFSKVYVTESVCSLTGATCTLHVPTILKTGLHTWTVQPYTGKGGGPVSLSRSFYTPTTVPGGVNLTYPFGPVGYYSPSFQWNELASPTAAKYTLKIYKDGKRLFNKTYEAIKICDGGSCTVPKPLKLKEGNYTWEVLPWNPAGYGPTASGAFDMHYANGYDNHFTDNLAGFTTLYPAPSEWWLDDSDLITWYGLDYTVASARIDATYQNIDVTATMYRSGDPSYANGILLRGTPTLVGNGKHWKSAYGFFYANDRYFCVLKLYGGKLYAIQPWGPSAAIINGTNKLRARAVGPNLSFYINDTLVWSGVDNAYGPDLVSGSVGILSAIGNWIQYRDYFFVDRISTTMVVGASEAGEMVSEEQQALNEAAMANPLGASYSVNLGTEEYEHLQAFPGVPGMSFDDKMEFCLADHPEICPPVQLP